MIYILTYTLLNTTDETQSYFIQNRGIVDKSLIL